MYQNLSIFQTASAMAKHAGARQAVIAQNVANADTPGYRAQSIGSFSDSYAQVAAGGMRGSRDGHIGIDQGSDIPLRSSISLSEPSPNGNSVSVEEEMLNAVSVSREHNRSLTIYRHAMTILRTSLGRQ